jgi:branched-chain amino acid aminotransferase
MPIREADNRVVGAGKRGPITERLQTAYHQQVRGERDSHPEWLSLVGGDGPSKKAAA